MPLTRSDAWMGACVVVSHNVQKADEPYIWFGIQSTRYQASADHHPHLCRGTQGRQWVCTCLRRGADLISASAYHTYIKSVEQTSCMESSSLPLVMHWSWSWKQKRSWSKLVKHLGNMMCYVTSCYRQRLIHPSYGDCYRFCLAWFWDTLLKGNANPFSYHEKKGSAGDPAELTAWNHQLFSLN